MVFLIAAATFLATSFGGLFALKFRDNLHLILGFSAGAVVGVAFFDLIPESVSIGGAGIITFVAIGFAAYLLIDRFVILHNHDEHDHASRGMLGASSLSIHSFLDGVAIGLAFQASFAIGAVVALAVLAHDFSDGINTVALIMKNGGSKKQAFKFLMLDAIAPVLGIVVTQFFTVPEKTLGVILAIFAGFFLCIGASDLIPESHHNHPTHWTTVATILGMFVIFAAVKLAGI